MTFPVLGVRYLPTRIPVMPGVVLWLLLDRVNAPAWACAVIWTLFAVGTLVALCVWWNERRVSPAELAKETRP